jgi:hypothetical protein
MPPCALHWPLWCAGVLNGHERWLVRRFGLNGHARRELLRELVAHGEYGGDVDVTRQLGGIELGKASVRADLPMVCAKLGTWRLSSR